MKNIKITLLVSLITFFFIGCEKQDDKFNGSTLGNGTAVVDLTGVISSSVGDAIGGQTIPFTVTLPQTFTSDANVFVKALSYNNNFTVSKVVVLAGQTTGTGSIETPANQVGIVIPFISRLSLSITGLTLTQVDLGKQYLMKSNVLNLRLGDSTIPVNNTTRLGARLDWPGPYNAGPDPLNPVLYNDIDCFMLNSLGTPISSSATGARFENVFLTNVQPDGVYTVATELYLLTSGVNPINLPYRVVLRFPNNDVRSYSGILNSVSAGDVVNLLTITKTTVSGVPSYVIVQL